MIPVIGIQWVQSSNQLNIFHMKFALAVVAVQCRMHSAMEYGVIWACTNCPSRLFHQLNDSSSGRHAGHLLPLARISWQTKRSPLVTSRLLTSFLSIIMCLQLCFDSARLTGTQVIMMSWVFIVKAARSHGSYATRALLIVLNVKHTPVDSFFFSKFSGPLFMWIAQLLLPVVEWEGLSSRLLSEWKQTKQ